MGESLEELSEDIDSFKQALKLPVLKMADIPATKKSKRNRNGSKNLTLEQVRAQLGLDQSTVYKNTRTTNNKQKVKTAREKGARSKS